MQSKRSAVRREAWAAGTMIVLGLGAIAQASTYTLGSLARMGPGMFPVILSGLIIAIGLILVVRSFFTGRATQFFGTVSWRAIIMLSFAIVLFGTFLREMGMLLALFVTCFLSALASKHIKLPEAAITAAGLAILCTAIFGPYGVKLPIPVIGTWFVN